MMRIKLSTPPNSPFLRQTPQARGVWGSCQFDVEAGSQPYDAWVVYEQLVSPETVLCPPQNTIFVTIEPPAVKRYNQAFLEQFAVVISAQDLAHPGQVWRQPATRWYIGVAGKGPAKTVRLTYDDFVAMPPPPKTKTLAILCSRLLLTREHARRVRFMDRLVKHFGDRVEVFGRGSHEVKDKWDAIAPYRYSIVLENTSCPHYWTEKLADTYLGWSFPIYWGCPNLTDYFPQGAFASIERDDPERSIDTIERILATDPYEERLPLLAEARRRVLDEYNVFALWSELCSRLEPSRAEPITLLPESAFEAPPGLARRTYRRLVKTSRSVLDRLT